jgi:Flp pilus assembly protein protease CpaA
MSLRRVSQILVWELILGLAVALIAYASQSAQMTHRDSPIAVILFATASILLFTLPRIGGDSRLPHIVVLIFGFTTLLAYLLGILVAG